MTDRLLRLRLSFGQDLVYAEYKKPERLPNFSGKFKHKLGLISTGY